MKKIDKYPIMPNKNNRYDSRFWFEVGEVEWGGGYEPIVEFSQHYFDIAMEAYNSEVEAWKLRHP